MAARIRTILLTVRDMNEIPRAALRKAATLARASGAVLELFHAAPQAPTPAGAAARGARRQLARAGAAERLESLRTQLARIGASPLLRGCRVRCVVVADAPAHEAIVRRVLASSADLVIAGTRVHSLGRRLLLANTDWELIRYCPCPLLLVRQGTTYHRPRILVALDPLHARAKPARLDELLLQEANRVAGALGGSVHAFHAYMPLIANVQSLMGEPLAWEDPQIEQMHGEQVRRQLDALASRAGIPARRRHLAMGDVPTELAAAAREIRAAIVVMGAVSRSGLGRLFVGNTAERVLDVIECDALIVKPRGFRTPVPRRA